ncbi:hypothetical protein [Virgisporangium aurantiacum]|uniref:Uncharacterized protein n=1 Tax=Virgisporangium aurantiacum TaxID=175570 RepID=A0A8J3Z8M6_9ACTN|nr:hypothetical protein [Virgisporangium aurantiacum]GIJ57231.1 hypothetical protein Vau01_047470 [Virgisporangium aurantiacum]
MFKRFRRGRDSQPADVYIGLRRQVLETDPARAGLSATPELPRVWGLLMDTTLDRGGFSFVALADGTTSLYFSTGGGMIGGGEHPQVAAANRVALRVVEAHLDEFPPATDDTLPPPGGVVLRALTYDGRRSVQAPEDDLGEGRHPLSDVFHAAHDVSTELRMLQEAG